MYTLTINGRPIGKPMTKLEAERKLSALIHSVLGLEMKRVRGL
jgi:hypothetical protein